MATRRNRQPNELCPDGVTIVVPWEEMAVGDSVFVPCIDVVEAEIQVRSVKALLRIGLDTQRRIEAQKLGLRIWRTA